MLVRPPLIATIAAIVAMTAPAAAAEPPPKRAVPDYDGRGDEPTTAADVLIWVPRIALSPVYLVSEYLIRRPLGFLVTEAERSDLPAFLAGLFTFDGGKAGVIPTFVFDFGLEAGALPSGGLYLFWDDLLFDGHDIRFRAAYGGSSDWITLDYTSRFHVADDSTLALEVGWDRRKDWVFGGIGPGFDDDARGRYGLDRLGVGLGYTLELNARSELSAGVRTEWFETFEGGCCDDPKIEQRIEDGVYPAPPGLGVKHTYLRPEVAVSYDTRATRPGDESGVRLEAFGDLGLDLRRGDAHFARYGAAVGLFWDLWKNRTVGLQLHGRFATPLGDGVVPFSELTLLGGAEPMRAFDEGRLRGESAFVAVLDYRWPIWVWLDGQLFFELGNAFGEYFDGLDGDNLRLSFGMGMRPSSHEDHPFELLFAAGTGPFGDGAEVTTFRVVFGTTSGF